MTCLAVLIEHLLATDCQTDRQTDRQIYIYIYLVSITSHGVKNRKIKTFAALNATIIADIKCYLILSILSSVDSYTFPLHIYFHSLLSQSKIELADTTK